MFLIQADRVSFAYPDSPVPILREVTFSVSPGELVGLIGPSGSGKTTLVKQLNGLLRPTGGRILLHGRDTGARRFPRTELRRHVGLVFQYPEQQLFKKTVLEDAMFGPLNLGIPREEARRAAREALSLVGLGLEYETRSPLELSGGEMRLAAIAGVLAMEPELLILDEPAAGLDPAAKERMLALLQSLRARRGTAVVLVSHSMEDIAARADRVLVLSGGCLLGDAPPARVFQETGRMRELGTGVPGITAAAEELRRRGVPLPVLPVTVPEAVDCFAAALREGRHAP